MIERLHSGKSKDESQSYYYNSYLKQVLDTYLYPQYITRAYCDIGPRVVSAYSEDLVEPVYTYSLISAFTLRRVT